MASYPAVFELSSINGVNGFQFNAQYGFGDVGVSVAMLGDVNGDGVADFIVGGPRNNLNGGGQNGSAFIVFGRNVAGVGQFPTDFQLQDLNGTNGFKVNGLNAGDGLGVSVSSAGDVNSDGIADILIGANGANRPNTMTQYGGAYVIFGKTVSVDGEFSAVFNLSTLDGTNGFSIPAQFNGSQLGIAVSSAGDINNDGIDDLLVGGGASGAGAGATYVIFGKDTATAGDFQANFNLAGLDGTNGFKINGAADGEFTGRAVSAAGDINGDGVDDLIIGAGSADPNGAYNVGSAFVVFGRDTAVNGQFTAALELSSLDGTNGFRMNGFTDRAYAGFSVASAGDVNGDGFDDFVVGARNGGGAYPAISVGHSYVVFGRDSATPFDALVSLANLDGTNGFRISGAGMIDKAGTSVSSAGDFNGDGIGDLLIGAPEVDTSGSNAGAVYVVFGKRTSVVGAFVADLNVSTLDGTNGFKINGETANDHIGISVSAGGDINGDGFDDLIFSSPNLNGSYTGGGYVLFGHAPVTQGLVLTANPAGQTLTGDAGNDILTGNVGNDVLYGLGGDDQLSGGAMADYMYGGAGTDTVRGGDGGDSIFGGDGGDDLDGEDGNDKLYGEAGDDIIVGASGNDYMYGGDDNDTLTGNAGNDMLDGGTGADRMVGGIANDVYIVDNLGDTVIELAGEGTDIIRNFISFTLSDNVEAIQLQGSGDIDGTGNALGNNMQGNAGANTLMGMAGVDNINGGDGDDIIIGGVNNDLLRGGGGADVFRVLEESVNTAALEIDIIYDFSALEGDRMDFSFIDADSLQAGNQAFELVSSFNHSRGQMTLTYISGQTLVRLDVDGDNSADYQLKINGDVTQSSGNWSL